MVASDPPLTKDMTEAPNISLPNVMPPFAQPAPTETAKSASPSVTKPGAKAAMTGVAPKRGEWGAMACADDTPLDLNSTTKRATRVCFNEEKNRGMRIRKQLAQATGAETHAYR